MALDTNCCIPDQNTMDKWTGTEFWEESARIGAGLEEQHEEVLEERQVQSWGSEFCYSLPSQFCYKWLI
jgi:hypothetical protein